MIFIRDETSAVLRMLTADAGGVIYDGASSYDTRALADSHETDA